MISDDLAYMRAFPPQREGFSFILYQHPLTGLYQWINDTDFSAAFGMTRIYPPLPGTGFGLARFGLDPFGR